MKKKNPGYHWKHFKAIHWFLIPLVLPISLLLVVLSHAALWVHRFTDELLDVTEEIWWSTTKSPDELS